ncbi:MAG: pyridoxamine 5'-phosphate oxidase family protein [Candidatus Parabeggiatoa sp. nov. 1]|nr:MAG: pyridoxamine 5'-phosphate oxidase family protein [Gammaproteobacteria bacterium]
MGQRYTKINDKFQAFIKQQQIFFVATAACEGRINISPKGMDTLRIIHQNQIVWLNLTGSGNETAAHLLDNNRMTLMFCAYEGEPLILRLYGYAKAYHSRDSEWDQLMPLFPKMAGARQIIDMNVDLVQSSCGMAVPYFEFAGEREQLINLTHKKGEAGIKQYWKDRNQISLDGKPTGIVE